MPSVNLARHFDVTQDALAHSLTAALAAQAGAMVVASDPDRPPALAPTQAALAALRSIPIAWLGDYLMVYDAATGHWRPGQRALLQALILVVSRLRPTWGLRQADQIVETIERLAPGFVQKDSPNAALETALTWDAEPIIPFANGYLRLPDLTLLPPDPAAHVSWCVPWPWTPAVRSARLDAFLEAVVPDPDSRRNLLAFLGYALARFDTSQHHFVYLLGGGQNGKSLFLKQARRLFGPYCVYSSNVPPANPVSGHRRFH